MNYFTKQARKMKRDNPTLKQDYRGREIEAAKLAGLFDGQFYAIIDGMVDFDIKPSRYAQVVIRRIKADYYYQRFPKCLKFGRAEVRNKAGRVIFSGSPVKTWKIVKESERMSK